jgi:hypothetical protein
MNRVFLTLASVLFLAFAATSQTTNGLSDAEIKGQQLAQNILDQIPVSDFTEKGSLRIEDSHHKVINAPFVLNTYVTNDFWVADYAIEPTNEDGAFVYEAIIELYISHKHGQPNRYLFFQDKGYHDVSEVPISRLHRLIKLTTAKIMAPFADSDFWIADLGLEFFHWPEQKVIKHEERRTRECTVLESTNPDPSTGGYSHVDSWIDDESHGIVHAEAYDTKGKLLKVFDPKSFKKVNGQWELQDMEIRNVQTGSRTWIKFDLSAKS